MNSEHKEVDAAPVPRAFDLRREERVEAAFPVFFDDGKSGTTRNVSTAGMYFETRHQLTLGAPLSIWVEFEAPRGGALRVRADAKILRVEDLQGRWGVAAAIHWRANVTL